MNYGSVPDPIAVAGDRVRIFAAKDCIYGYEEEMEEYVGMEATVVRQRWNSGKQAYEYFLDVDDEDYYWCDKCIEPLVCSDIEESDLDPNLLFS